MRFSRSSLTAAALIAAAQLLLAICQPASAFGFNPSLATRQAPTVAGFSLAARPSFLTRPRPSSPVVLRMSDAGGGGGGTSREKSTKKGLKTITIDKTEQKMEEDKKKEEMWRVVLHNDEINTFQHVTRAITQVITTLDRKRAFDICMTTHGIGKATVTKTWRKKAEQYCLNLQRQGLTVSIAPDKAFGGGGEGGGGGGGGGPDMS